MNYLVCISKTPDTTSKISFKNNDTEYNGDGINYIMNPYDEWYALVRAIELSEQHGGTVTVINVGNASNDIIIRKALAIGANDAVRIDTEPHDAFTVAANIADYAKDKNFGIIFLGKETIDYNGSEVGAMVAELLDLPYVSYVSKLELNGSTSMVTRDIEGGVEVCSVEGPLVLSSAKGIAEQRIPNMKGIMMAKSKPLQVLQPTQTEPRVKTEKFVLPNAKSGVRLVDPENMDELVRLLHEEAKVI
ncbi:MAG: electron transfer flavoprotein subunit beta/FixA family protein [Saprospiraceae bacterium]|jgi:electron transfer flavoprotein beta subunit|nr:electron transfer flavoprotein subunit beta/FixA family protein [Saprospiraceae bacterium]